MFYNQNVKALIQFYVLIEASMYLPMNFKSEAYYNNKLYIFNIFKYLLITFVLKIKINQSINNQILYLYF